MEARVQKWGNSLAIRIPKAFANQVGLADMAAVDLSVEGNTLIVTPLQEPELTLADLLARVTPENIHGEVSTGPSVGNEAW